MRSTVGGQGKEQKASNFRELARPRGFELLTFGIGMQKNCAYIVRAIQ